MASTALRGFSSIASRAPQVFRTIWSTIKSIPALSSLKDAIIGQVLSKGVSMIDQKMQNKPQLIRNMWDIAKQKVTTSNFMKNKQINKKTFKYKKI